MINDFNLLVERLNELEKKEILSKWES